jgi:hypothetical protein
MAQAREDQEQRMMEVMKIQEKNKPQGLKLPKRKISESTD